MVHIFVITDAGIGFDVNGYNEVPLLLQAVSGWSHFVPILTFPEAVRLQIASLSFEQDTHRQILSIAEKLVKQIL